MDTKYPFAYNKDLELVNVDKAKQGEIYSCIFCGTRMIPKLRGVHKIKHFAHKEKCTETWNYDMSDWHKFWQGFFPGKTEVVMEREGNKHIADVVLNNTVIEFQHSHISIDEFRDRNDFYTSLGYKVVWLFDLTELFNKEQIKETYNDIMFKWSYTRTPFKEMDLRKEKAQIFFQLKDINDNEDKIIYYPIKQLDNFKFFFSDYKHTLSTNEFIKRIENEQKDDFFSMVTSYYDSEDRDNYPFVMSDISTKYIPEFDEPQYISYLWDPRFYNMTIKNVKSNYVFKVYSGSTKTGLLQKKQKNGYYRSFGNFVQIYDYKSPVWERIGYSLINNKDVLEQKAYNDYLEHLYGNQNISWSKLGGEGEFSQSEESDLITLLNNHYPKPLILKLKEHNLYVLFKNTFHTTYNEDEIYRYYNAYYFDLNENEFLSNFPINYYIRKNYMNNNWIKIDFLESEVTIENKPSSDPKYVSFEVKEPASFGKGKLLNEITSGRTNFVAKNEGNDVICFFKKVGYSYNVYRYNITTQMYDENDLLNYDVFSNWKNDKWQVYRHYDPGIDLREEVEEIRKKIIDEGKYPEKNGAKLFTIHQLREEYNDEELLAKCTIKDYIYRFSFSYARGFRNTTPKVEIFDEETGENLTGSVEAFNFEMLSLPIWHIYNENNEYEEKE